MSKLLGFSFIAGLTFGALGARADEGVFKDIVDEANRLYQREGRAEHVIASHSLAASAMASVPRQMLRPIEGSLFRRALQECLFFRRGVGTTHFNEGRQAAVVAQFELYLERMRSRGVREFFRIEAPGATIWPFSAPLMAPCALGVVVGGRVLLLRGSGGR